MLIRVTMYYKPFEGITERQTKMEGGPTDRIGKPLCSLEEYLAGKVKYVSLSCDKLAGPPGNDKRFTVYGTKVSIPEVEALVGRTGIEFRLVDTGDHFRGKGKVASGGAEPIDLCRQKPLMFPRTEGTMTLNFL